MDIQIVQELVCFFSGCVALFFEIFGLWTGPFELNWDGFKTIAYLIIYNHIESCTYIYIYVCTPTVDPIYPRNMHMQKY